MTRIFQGTEILARGETWINLLTLLLAGKFTEFHAVPYILAHVFVEHSGSPGVLVCYTQ